MNKNKLIFAAIIALLALLAGAFVFVEWFGPKRTFTLEISGKPGLEIFGTVIADGAVRDVTLTLPAKETLEGMRIAFAFAPKDGKRDERIKVQVSVDGDVLGSYEPPDGIHGEFYEPRLFRGLRGVGWLKSLNGANPATIKP
jgi:hypothetical protein